MKQSEHPYPLALVFRKWRKAHASIALSMLRLAAGVTILALGLVSCSLPGASQPASPSPAADEPAAAASEGVEIPAGVLTEVAATLFAPYQATWTAQANRPPASTQPAQLPAPTQATDTPVASPTPAPTQTQAPAAPLPTDALPTAAITLLPTAGIESLPTAGYAPLPTAAMAPTYQPALPPAQFVAQTGQAFTVFGLNLHDCGGEYAANFLIENTGSQALESLSLHFIDLSTGQDLYDPLISNAPFSWTDRTCASDGVSRLAPGEWLFAGALLGPGRLSGHSILANFLFCTQENLSGQCYPRSAEFVVP